MARHQDMEKLERYDSTLPHMALLDSTGEHFPSLDLTLPRDEPQERLTSNNATFRDVHFDLEAQRPRNLSTTSTLGLPPGIYWRTPIVQVCGLLLGTTFVVLLDRWYHSFDTHPVGSTSDQQTALRIGTGLAWCASVSLVFSTSKVYDQWIWRELKDPKQVIAFKGIDAACSATTDPASFANPEMWRKTKVASVLALLIWLLPVASLIAPATLNVVGVVLPHTIPMNIPTLDISQYTQYTSYSYTVAGTITWLLKFAGPRTVIERLAVAVSSNGQILDLPQPSPNSTYQQTIFGPYIQCSVSTPEVIQQTNGMINQFKAAVDPSVELISLDYFSAIPALSNDLNTSDAVQPANFTNINSALYASNQLWIYYTTYNTSMDFSKPQQNHYLTCELYNASLVTNFTWRNGQQEIEVIKRTPLHKVAYPASASTTPESEESMAYSSVFWAQAIQLTGTIAFYRDIVTPSNESLTITAGRIYSSIDSSIAATMLVGTADLNSHFAENHLLGTAGNATSLYSPQRLQDMAYARNRSLEVLIPELSQNITLSLISDPLLAPSTSTPVTIYRPTNIYTYHARNLWLSFGLAIATATLANIAGLYAMRASGLVHDMSFSSIVCASHGVHFDRELRPNERLGALPLPERIAETKVRFVEGRGFCVCSAKDGEDGEGEMETGGRVLGAEEQGHGVEMREGVRWQQEAVAERAGERDDLRGEESERRSRRSSVSSMSSRGSLDAAEGVIDRAWREGRSNHEHA